MTNKNTGTADRKPTLTATYTSGGVTCTDKTVVTLLKSLVDPSPVVLESIKISGASSIAYESSSYYTCTATWSDGSTGPVSPKWSLSSTEYASVDSSGKVTNKNTGTIDRKPTLTATYTWGGVTCTDKKSVTLLKLTDRTLKSISISGASSISYGGVASYICTATWSDGNTSQVTPKWSLSSTDYATVDTTGKVTNKNTSTADKSPTLTATYTSGSMTCTAKKSVTLLKFTDRTLKSISISGASSISYGGASLYTCMATWSDGSTSNVTPKWSLSSTDYATVDSSGKVTNKNTSSVDRSPTLTATYTSGSVTCTVKKSITLKSSVRTLTSISISGSSSISYGGVVSYVCTATWSDGSTSTETAKWSLSSTDYATVDSSGKVTNKNTTVSVKNSTLTASYTYGSATKTASKSITLSIRDYNLVSIAIDGSSSIENGYTSSYTCTATWSDGSTSKVTPKWSLSSSDYASVDSSGNMTNKNTSTVDKSPTLKASYSFCGVTKTASKVVKLLKPGRSLVSISINGSSSIDAGSSSTYTCKATWSDGSTSTVTPKWSLSSTDYASVDSTGKMTNKNTSTVDKKPTLKASYTHDGITCTAAKAVKLIAK